jgi:hypothetical protein
MGRGGGRAGYSIATQLELTDACGNVAGYPKFPPNKATRVVKNVYEKFSFFKKIGYQDVRFSSAKKWFSNYGQADW